MFTQAGFNWRMRRVGVVAMVRHERRTWRWRRAELVRHAGGDWFWWGGGARVAWGDVLVFRQFVHLPLDLVGWDGNALPRCHLGEPAETVAGYTTAPAQHQPLGL